MKCSFLPCRAEPRKGECKSWRGTHNAELQTFFGELPTQRGQTHPKFHLGHDGRSQCLHTAQTLAAEISVAAPLVIDSSSQ